MEVEDAASIDSNSSGIVEDAGLLSDVDESDDNEFIMADDDDIDLYDVGYDTEATETTEALGDFIGLDPNGILFDNIDPIQLDNHVVVNDNNNNNDEAEDVELEDFQIEDSYRDNTGWTSTESLYHGDTDIADLDSFDLAPPPSPEAVPLTRKRLRTISDSSSVVVCKKRRARQFEMVQLYTALESE